MKRRDAILRPSRWAVSLLALLLPGLAAASEGVDFDPKLADWNGLAYLGETASEAEVGVQVESTLDWSKLRGEEILVVVAPLVALGPGDADSLRRFVEAGGRVVLADDFREGDSWLSPFAIRRVAEPGSAPEYGEDLPQFPAFPGQDVGSFLGFQVDRVVLNHPAALLVEPLPSRRGELQPTRVALGRYLDGVRCWLVEVRQGRGRLLALADPSVLIDAMLRAYHGDKQFAANLLRWGCYAGETCKVRLYANLQRMQGTFVPPAGEGGRSGGLLDAVERGLQQLAAWMRRREAVPLGWALTLLALVVPAVLASRLPRAVVPETGRRLLDTSRLAATISAWLARPDADYRRPARQLAHRLARSLRIAEGRDPMGGASPTELRDAMQRLRNAGRLPVQAGQRLDDVVATLVEISAPDSDVDRATFNTIAAEVEWAEQVLRHTDSVASPTEPRPFDPRQGASSA